MNPKKVFGPNQKKYIYGPLAAKARSIKWRLDVLFKCISCRDKELLASVLSGTLGVLQSECIRSQSKGGKLKTKESFKFHILSARRLNVIVWSKTYGFASDEHYIASNSGFGLGEISFRVANQDQMPELIARAGDDSFPTLFILTSHNVNKDTLAAVSKQSYNDIVRFIIHDYDNHHALNSSLMSSSVADDYIVAHPHNISTLMYATRRSCIPIIPAPVTQFSRSQVSQLLSLNSLPDRYDGPYGEHIYYPQFPYRNHIIQKCAGYSNYVRLVHSAGYKPESAPKEPFEFWSSFATTFVSPVNHDLPQRLLDSLITGSIPIVPASIEWVLELARIPKNFYVTYTYSDLESMQKVISKAVNLYHNGGICSLQERVKFILDNHHVDSFLCNQIKQFAAEREDQFATC